MVTQSPPTSEVGSSIRGPTNLYSTTFLSDLIGREGSRDIMVTMAMEVTSFLRDLIGRDVGDVIMVSMALEVTSRLPWCWKCRHHGDHGDRSERSD